MKAAVLLSILVGFNRPYRRVGSRCRSLIGFSEGSHVNSRGTGSRQWNWLLGPQARGKLRTGRWEQVNFMAPKNVCSSRMKPGVGVYEWRLLQSLPSGAASNAGKKMTLKPQGALGNKQSAQIVDAGSGTGTKGVMHHREGLIIPDIFENPQPITCPPPLAGRTAMSKSLVQSQKSMERGSGDFVTGFTGDEEPLSLHLIYQTMMAQHKQTQGDNKKARVASKQLQVAVSKIAKPCSEIGDRIATIESHTSVLETELGRWHSSQLCMNRNSRIFSGKWRILKIGDDATICASWGFKKERKAKTQGLS
ncbi:hypothetical protein NDU88_002008 [Pleurodeles waltl]|uniref:Uncharacterized protein n=1 Tax=Pleurodeles waltl TaxID=8319 RepID=A0AAV7NCH3_PLEWA|nr:hypothetical protein NDU88_002008 [Pleurodeles waltl]